MAKVGDTMSLSRNPAKLGLLAVGCVLGLSGAQASEISIVPDGATPFGVYDPGGDFADVGGVTVEHLFLPWEDVALDSLFDADVYARARDRVLLVTIEPWTWSRDERNTPDFLRRSIGEGVYDSNMLAICGILGQLQSPVTVRWGHEMDDDRGQFIWAGWDPEDYIRAYRHVIDLCRSVAPEVAVMWSPLGDEGMEDYWPGEGYADIVGLTVFGLQAYDQLHYDRDRSFEEILAPRYARAATFGLPIVVAELGFVGEHAYVAKWNDEVRLEYPEFSDLVGVVYFNYPEVHSWPDNLGRPDWRVHHRVIE